MKTILKIRKSDDVLDDTAYPVRRLIIENGRIIDHIDENKEAAYSYIGMPGKGSTMHDLDIWLSYRCRPDVHPMNFHEAQEFGFHSTGKWEEINDSWGMMNLLRAGEQPVEGPVDDNVPESKICRCPAPHPGHVPVQHVEGCHVGKTIAAVGCSFCGAKAGQPCVADGGTWIMPGIHNAVRKLPEDA